MADPFLAEIKIFAGNFAPRGWAFCQGQILSIAQNTALFSLLGTTYGGNGQTTFALPDLRGRVPVGMGQGPGLSQYLLGQQAGLEAVTLLASEMPAHTHTATSTANARTPAGNSNDAAGRIWADDAGVSSATYSTLAANAQMSPAAITTTVAVAGGGQPHTNVQPYLALSFIIALQGIFPSRN